MKGKKQMAVYAISDTVEITDPQMLAEYVQRIAPTLKKYGVKPLVAGSAGYETIEGIWQTQGMTILKLRIESISNAGTTRPSIKRFSRSACRPLPIGQFLSSRPTRIILLFCGSFLGAPGSTA